MAARYIVAYGLSADQALKLAHVVTPHQEAFVRQFAADYHAGKIQGLDMKWTPTAADRAFVQNLLVHKA
jgi:hypothetical protein